MEAPDLELKFMCAGLDGKTILNPDGTPWIGKMNEDGYIIFERSPVTSTVIGVQKVNPDGSVKLFPIQALAEEEFVQTLYDYEYDEYLGWQKNSEESNT